MPNRKAPHDANRLVRPAGPADHAGDRARLPMPLAIAGALLDIPARGGPFDAARKTVMALHQGLTRLGGRGYRKGVEDCAHDLIYAGEQGGLRDTVGPEQRLRLAVERIVEMMFNR